MGAFWYVVILCICGQGEMVMVMIYGMSNMRR